MNVLLIKEGSEYPYTKIRQRLQEIGSVKEVFVVYKPHFRVDVINEIECMTNNDAKQTAFEIMAAEYPLDQEDEPYE